MIKIVLPGRGGSTPRRPGGTAGEGGQHPPAARKHRRGGEVPPPPPSGPPPHVHMGWAKWICVGASRPMGEKRNRNRGRDLY